MTRRRAAAKIEVIVPGKKSNSPSDTAQSSLSGTPGTSTPATSVSTGMESDAKKTRIVSSARKTIHPIAANARARPQQKRGTKRSASDMAAANTQDDAALAEALQQEEYMAPAPKKQKLSNQNARTSKLQRFQDIRGGYEVSDSEDDLSDDLTSDEESRPPSLITDEGDIWDSEEGDEDDYLENARAEAAAEVSGALYQFTSGPSASPDPSSDPNAVGPSFDESEDSEVDPDEHPMSWDERRKAGRAAKERKKLVSKHPVVETMWDELKAQPILAPAPAQQPSSITRKLKPFQLEGLSWMIEQEKSSYRGGLLGDEMGMGKTIQAVSLIMSDFPQPDPTLVIVPPVALMQWQKEIQEYTNGKLKVLVYHGSDSKVKKLTESDLRKYDVIMISYSSLESMHRKQEKGWSRGGNTVKADSVIHCIHYHRLILDEAHSIKQRTTGVAKACFALNANFKWCLSGTPVQNRIGEFFSLLRFLQLRPFASYFCKQCPCEELQWMADRQGRCTKCNHTGFNHISVFNKEILNPITEGRTQKERKEGLAKLRLITDHIMLRRLKEEHTSSMELPPKRITIHNEFFGEIEHDFSRSIMTNTGRQFDTYVSRGVMLNNYANIFGLIMQMRQVANHPDLILKKQTQPGHNVLVCTICDEPAEDAIQSRCRHDFCRRCVTDYVESFGSKDTVECPRCHIALSIDLEQPTKEQEAESVKKTSIINRISMENWTSSTKIETLLYELYRQRSKSHTPKSIIFSQFTSMLQLVEWRLRHAGFNTVMLDGTMTPAQRQNSINHFMTNADVEVFLVSLKAGGVALNLTEASRVFIVDPWWNPAAEWQSADRSHRIGQQRPCVITRLTIEDSVESRIVQLQEKKANLIRGTINKDQAAALEKLTPEDMQFLFRGS
ncbi:DNA repair protein RAD16 [Penicillium manginii]|jgi:DNA repair protein RAD16|uniref:DNA repair protein RAD16 n=1 Tax=Penicillium manginii TaxID=203109 RepID=UPI0025484B56|nr:DNA repair protein RAD16 [Penicillium manginii]KAJ5739662.1 DNA repair protein RAD16 [Penicillium manginii]